MPVSFLFPLCSFDSLLSPPFVRFLVLFLSHFPPKLGKTASLPVRPPACVQLSSQSSGHHRPATVNAPIDDQFVNHGTFGALWLPSCPPSFSVLFAPRYLCFPFLSLSHFPPINLLLSTEDELQQLVCSAPPNKAPVHNVQLTGVHAKFPFFHAVSSRALSDCLDWHLF